MDRMTRRRFLRAAAAGGLLYAFGRTPGTVTAHAAGLGGFSDYKALVCVFLFGGNDSWSMVVPRSSAEYDTYAASRRNLAIARDTLLPITPLDGTDFGMHPSMPGLASLFESGRCAVVANVGPLIEPTSRDQYRNKGVLLPPQLFSHNDQQTQWHTLRGRQQSRTGWAGRVADALAAEPVRPAAGDERLVVGDDLVPGGHVGGTVRDGEVRSAGVQGFRHDGLAVGATRCVRTAPGRGAAVGVWPRVSRRSIRGRSARPVSSTRRWPARRR